MHKLVERALINDGRESGLFLGDYLGGMLVHLAGVNFLLQVPRLVLLHQRLTQVATGGCSLLSSHRYIKY